MAAAILKAGESRIKIDPQRTEDAAKAVTKDDVRGLIRQGVVTVVRKKGVSRAIGRLHDAKKRKGGRHGFSKRRGTHGARAGGKKEWLLRVRAQRKLLKALKEKGQIASNAAYRETYLKIKGGAFPDRARVKMFLKEKNYLTAAEKTEAKK
ncbi:50S ribosomal protein L19e [uncultured archaeon]|nr:50S ribosomal protein L19e [uncultured archaeon]